MKVLLQCEMHDEAHSFNLQDRIWLLTTINLGISLSKRPIESGQINNEDIFKVKCKTQKSYLKLPSSNI